MPRRPRSRAIDGPRSRVRRPVLARRGGGGLSLADWAIPGSAVDFDFQNNIYAQNQYPRGPATSQFTLTRTTAGYAQANSGIWSAFSSGQFRQTDRGLLIEEARTNNLLQCRDMTNAAWVKGATVTVAQNQTGIDGTVNSATLVTGGAVTATNTVLQTITLGSAADTYSVWLKRVTGSGTIEISADGSTWTGVTLNTSYQQFQVQQTLANPVCGIRITTNGDQLAADFSQLETGAFATSPVLTTAAAATRNADVITMTTPSLISTVSAGTWFAEWRDIAGATGAYRTIVRATDAVAVSVLYGGSSVSTRADVLFTDGTNLSDMPATTGPAVNGIYRIATAAAAANLAAAYTASLSAGIVTDNITTTGPGTVSTSVTIGSGAGATLSLGGYIRRLAWVPARQSNSTLLAWAQGVVGP